MSNTPHHQIAFQALVNRLFLESIPAELDWDGYSLVAHYDVNADSLSIANFLYQGHEAMAMPDISPEAAALLVVWRLELPEAVRWHACIVQISRTDVGDIVQNALLMADPESGNLLRPTPENLEGLALFAHPR